MTGESHEVKKEILQKCISIQKEKEAETCKTTAIKGARRHDLPSPILMSGTSVSNGEGKMLALVVGEASCLGDIIRLLKVKLEVTPL